MFFHTSDGGVASTALSVIANSSSSFLFRSKLCSEAPNDSFPPLLTVIVRRPPLERPPRPLLMICYRKRYLLIFVIFNKILEHLRKVQHLNLEKEKRFALKSQINY